MGGDLPPRLDRIAQLLTNFSSIGNHALAGAPSV